MAAKGIRRLRSNFLYVLFLLTVLLLAGEVIVRLMGGVPWQPPSQSLEVRPEGPFFVADSVLGYRGRPGGFDLALRQGDAQPLHFRVTHNAEGYRPAAPPSDTAPDSLAVWIFGGSFAHGYGVDDSATFPWRIHGRLPFLSVRNYGMDGYGTYHSLLQLRAALAAGEAPRVVVLAYGGFHDQRNVNSRYWRKALSSQKVAEGIAYPYLRRAEDGSLEEHIGPIDYQAWPGMRYSAFVHYLENAWNRSEDASLDSYGVTREVIREMKMLCEDAGARFLLAGIFPDEGTRRMVAELQGEVDAVDISEGLELEENRILPTDLHPNAAGHQLLANRLIPLLAVMFAERLPPGGDLE